MPKSDGRSRGCNSSDIPPQPIPLPSLLEPLFAVLLEEDCIILVLMDLRADPADDDADAEGMARVGVIPPPILLPP